MTGKKDESPLKAWLENIDPDFGRYSTAFRKRGIDTKEKLLGLKDENLKTMDFKEMNIKAWREKVKYPEGSWMRILYDNKLGQHVLKFEQNDVEDIRDLTAQTAEELVENFQMKNMQRRRC
eukprot:UN27968